MDATDWAPIAAGAAREAGDLDPALLGDFLPELAAVCGGGARLDRHRLSAFRALGARAADDGVALPSLIDLYLSAAWRAWPALPSVAGADADTVRDAGAVVLHAVDDVVAAAADGFRAARRAAVRVEESARREFVDDLLAGTGDPVEMLHRAERFGVDPTGPHLVAVASGTPSLNDSSPVLSQITSAAPGALVVTRGGVLVAVVPATGAERATATRIAAVLGSRLGAGRVHPGVAGVARSYAEAQEALRLAARLRGAENRAEPRLGRRAGPHAERRPGRGAGRRATHRVEEPTEDRKDDRDPDRDGDVVFADDQLIYRVLVRDRPAMEDLITAVLAPLATARGGAGPLLATLDAYLATGGNTVATARLLHLSARAVTYRLTRIRDLTGRDPADPEDRFVLQAARLGSRALGDPPPPL